MEDSNNETLLETPNPPLKKARPWDRDIETILEEQNWYFKMRLVREKHIVRAVYENAMNSLIEGSGSLRAIEDEAVRMAIRSHGLTCSTEQLRPNPEDLSRMPEEASTSYAATCSSSTDDILSQAVTAAIRKKGLGALDR